MPIKAHYVSSTHWDREWYEPFQGFRMRLVSLLDEVLNKLEKDTSFKCFYTDGQVIPFYDYLEIRPEKREVLEKFLRGGRLKAGPWYVLPDEWLVCGESLIRNILFGTDLVKQMGGEPSRAGFACDMFGHTGQLPQIFSQLGLKMSFIWRGTYEKEHHGVSGWEAPDGTIIPTYRFGRSGYCTLPIDVRGIRDFGNTYSIEKKAGLLAEYTMREKQRTPGVPILLFDGGDHIEIDSDISEIIKLANLKLISEGIEIVHSDLDTYMDDLLTSGFQAETKLYGELRETGRDPVEQDEQWLIPGTLSSRIHLKQMNVDCEDELILRAEPLSAFASGLGVEYPEGYLRAAWKHLIENHPHDSICGCSLDQVHSDMIYKFGQSLGISSCLTKKALKAIAYASALEDLKGDSLVFTVFNHTALELNEPVDLDIPLPTGWPVFREFFGYEDKFSFRIYGPDGVEIPYQVNSRKRDVMGFRRERGMFPEEAPCHVVNVTAPLKIPGFGFVTLTAEPSLGPVRYPGSMVSADNTIENEFLRAEVSHNSSLSILNNKTGKVYDRLLTFEDRADIGDGWFHGIAVNDEIYSSVSCHADVSVISDGPFKAVMRIAITMNVPAEFDFRLMKRSDEKVPLRIVSEVTLRKGASRIEFETMVENNAKDHRLRVLFPTRIDGDKYMCDSAFDVVERPIALASDNNIRRELEVETRPQVTWTVFGDKNNSLATVSRGIPESAVIDRPDHPIALTLLRSFRKVYLSNDNPGGQVKGIHKFRFFVVPSSGEIPTKELFILGQRVNRTVTTSCLTFSEIEKTVKSVLLPPEYSFLEFHGKGVITSVQRIGGKLSVRLFNPYEKAERMILKANKEKCVPGLFRLDSTKDDKAKILNTGEGFIEFVLPSKRITTVVFG